MALTQQRTPTLGTVTHYGAGVGLGRGQVQERGPRHVPFLEMHSSAPLEGQHPPAVALSTLAEKSGEQQASALSHHPYCSLAAGL